MIVYGLVVTSYVVYDARRGVEVYQRHIFAFTEEGRVSIVYVAANQTSQEIYCKLRNDGPNWSTLTELRVNGTRVDTGGSLPLNFERLLDYKTFVFQYNGSWQDSILITFLYHPGDYPTAQKLVDLRTVSANPISGAYTSELDRLNILLARGVIFEWTKSAFILGLAIVAPLLIWRSRRPITHFPTPLGGAIVASSFIFSIYAAAVTLAFPEPYRLPTIIQATLPILVPYVAGPALIVGSALVVIALKHLAEHYHDPPVWDYAVAGFIFMITCVVTAAVSTYAAYDLGSTFGNDALRVAPLAPIAPPLVMKVEAHGLVPNPFSTAYGLFASWALLLFAFSSSFFILSLNRLSKKTNTKKLKTIVSLLIVGTVLVTVCSLGISLLILAWYSGIGDLLLVVDFAFTALVLGGVAYLSAAWLLLTRVFYSMRLAHVTQLSPTDKSENAQELQAALNA